MNRNILSALVFSALAGTAQLQGGVIENLVNKFWQKEEPKPATIKILVVHDKPGVLLEVKGKYKIYDPHQDAFISTRFIGKRKFMQAMNDSLRWGEEFPGVHQLKIVPDSTSTTTLVDGIEYKGAIYVYDIGGTISVVNELPLDDYLRVSLNSTFSPNLPDEAAAAVAIAARGNAWYLVQNPKSEYFAVEASKIGYRGHAAGETKKGLDLAIAETKDMIVAKDGHAFANSWTPSNQAASSLLTVEEAAELARRGEHAAQILSKAFPGSKVSLINEQ